MLFFQYLYTGKIQFDYATVIPLVSLADKYNVKDLLRIGLDYMTRNVSLACKRNQVVSWYQFTHAAGHNHVSDLCKDFIKANFSMIADNIDFPNLEVYSLLNFIQCNDLVVEDEMELFRCVDKWLRAQTEIMTNMGEENISIHFDRYVELLIPNIRFPMMSPSQLADLILNPLAQTHMELLVEKIRIAMAYHKNQLTEADLSKDFCDPRLFTPRLYTKEHFCASMSIEHVHNLPSYHCRRLNFSSHKYTISDFGEDHMEWMVDVYPKGVWIQKCLTVYQPSGVEVPGRVLKTVRVTITSPDEEERRVKIGLLLSGSQEGFEHVRKVVTRNFIFSEQDQVLNFDDLLDYDDLNNLKQRSNFLSGVDRDTIQISVVIVPLTKMSTLDP